MKRASKAFLKALRKSPKRKAQKPRVRRMTEAELMAEMRGERKKPRRVVLGEGNIGMSGWYYYLHDDGGVLAAGYRPSHRGLRRHKIRLVAEVLK